MVVIQPIKLYFVKTLFSALLLVSFIACTKDNPNNGYKDYLIPANQHYAVNTGLEPMTKKELRFLALFDSSCIYTNRDPKNIYDINKLYGFSDCGTLHHENSARVGWLWNGKAIELHAYCYTDSLRNNKLLGTVAIGKPAELSMSVQANQYIFTYNGTQTTMPRHCNSSSINGYRLYPYFGGDETAPHDIHIYIKEL